MTEHHHKDGDGTDIDDILSTLINHEKSRSTQSAYWTKQTQSPKHTCSTRRLGDYPENQSEGVLTLRRSILTHVEREHQVIRIKVHTMPASDRQSASRRNATLTRPAGNRPGNWRMAMNSLRPKQITLRLPVRRRTQASEAIGRSEAIAG